MRSYFKKKVLEHMMQDVDSAVTCSARSSMFASFIMIGKTGMYPSQ